MGTRGISSFFTLLPECFPFLSLCSPPPHPEDTIVGCELMESGISPLTAIKSKKNQPWWTLAYFSNWCGWDERDSWLLWPLQDNCVSCVAWIKGCAIAAKMGIDTILLFNNILWCVSSKYINSCHPWFLCCSPPKYFVLSHGATWWVRNLMLRIVETHAPAYFHKCKCNCWSADTLSVFTRARQQNSQQQTDLGRFFHVLLQQNP